MDGKGKNKFPKELRKKGGIDDLTEAGTMLGAVGGIIIGSSALTSWVNDGSADYSVFELVDESRLYLILLVAQLLALVCAMISAILLRSSDWPRERKLPWAMPLVAFNVIMIVFIAITIVMMESDFFDKGDEVSYGPGPYLGIFGLMFSWVGALMFVLDARDKARMRPIPRTERRQRMPEPVMEEAVEPGYVQCPNCGEDVPDDSPICPNCNAVLSEEGQEDDLDEEDLDRVR